MVRIGSSCCLYLVVFLVALVGNSSARDDYQQRQNNGNYLRIFSLMGGGENDFILVKFTVLIFSYPVVFYLT